MTVGNYHRCKLRKFTFIYLTLYLIYLIFNNKSAGIF